jgi:hypothetical protein
MEYITDIYVNNNRVATHARLHTAQEDYNQFFDDSDLFDTVEARVEHNGVITVISGKDQFEAYVLGAERAHAWKPKSDTDLDFYDEYTLKHGTVKGYVASRNFNSDKEFSIADSAWEKQWNRPRVEFSTNDAINPPHYKDIVPGYQYMEMMVHMLEGLDGVESHLMGQVYKYLMRCGKKDEELQELKKAKWYLDALVKYHEEGKVI